MAASPPPNRPPAPDRAPDAARDDLQRLRHLLLAPEQEHLSDLARRLDRLEALDHQADVVSRVLPESVGFAARRSDHLVRALAPILSESLRLAATRDPKQLGDVLFPVVGPAIRKSIAEALREFLDNVNRVLEHSFSVQGWRWRFEAWSTGRPFSEVVMHHTLLYRVEQVFLIHRATGLLIRQVTADGVAGDDGDLASSMLVALESFAQDSFGADADDTLATLEVGDLLVWVEEGPQAMVAAVIRGAPSPQLREVLRELNETIHRLFYRDLIAFDGDDAPFEDAEPLLETGLHSQFTRPPRRRSVQLYIAGVLLLAVLLALAFFTWRNRTQWTAYLDRLHAEPGLVVTDAERGWRGLDRLEGLRDPLAADPEQLRIAAGLAAPGVSRWHPYQSLDSAVVVRRAERMLAPSSAVALSYDGSVLRAAGTASAAWVAEAAVQAPTLAGVDRFDGSAVTDPNRVHVLAEQIERATLAFEPGTSQVANPAAIDSVAAWIVALEEQRATSNGPVQVLVRGHASQDGPPSRNDQLSEARAEVVQQALVDRGVPARLLEARGYGAADDPVQGIVAARLVTFRVVQER